MDLDTLRVFVAVVETGSFKAAAARLSIARATVRRRVGELEAEAGVPLLRQCSSGWTPTEAGGGLAVRGRAILDEARAALEGARDHGSEPTGDLHLLVPVGMPLQVTNFVFGATLRAWPKLNLHDRQFDERPGEWLAEAEIVMWPGDALPPGSWHIVDLPSIAVHLLASPRYLAASPKIEQPEDLRAHTLLVWRSPGRDPGLLPTSRGVPLRVSPRVVSSDILRIREQAKVGLGIVYAPDGKFVPRSRRHGELVPVLDGIVGERLRIRLLIPTALARVPKIRAIIKSTERAAKVLR